MTIRVQKVKLCPLAKFHGDQSNCCLDMATHRFFNMAVVCHLGLVVCVRTTNEDYLVVFIILQNLVEISAAVLIICS